MLVFHAHGDTGDWTVCRVLFTVSLGRRRYTDVKPFSMPASTFRVFSQSAIKDPYRRRVRAIVIRTRTISVIAFEGSRRKNTRTVMQIRTVFRAAAAAVTTPLRNANYEPYDPTTAETKGGGVRKERRRFGPFVFPEKKSSFPSRGCWATHELPLSKTPKFPCKTTANRRSVDKTRKILKNRSRRRIDEQRLNWISRVFLRFPFSNRYVFDTSRPIARL